MEVKRFKGAVKTADFEAQDFKATTTEKGSRIIEGYFSTKDLDRGNDITEPGAFTKTLNTFMKNPLLMFMHDWRKAMGTVLEHRVDAKGVWIRAEIAKGVGWIDDIWKLMEQGVIKGFSFGYKVLKSEPAEISGKKVTLLKEVELLEVSVVTIPMNAAALFTTESGSVKGVAIRTTPEPSNSSDVVFKELRFDSSKFTQEDAEESIKSMGLEKKGEWFTEGDDRVYNLIDPEALAKNMDFVVTNQDGISAVYAPTSLAAVEKGEEGSSEESSTEEDSVASDEEEKKAGVDDDSSKEDDLTDEEKGIIQERVEQNAAYEAFFESFWVLKQELIKIDPANRAAANAEAGKLIKEFAGILKVNVLGYIKFRRDQIAERAANSSPVFASLSEEAGLKFETIIHAIEEDAVRKLFKEHGEEVAKLLTELKEQELGTESTKGEDKEVDPDIESVSKTIKDLTIHVDTKLKTEK